MDLAELNQIAQTERDRQKSIRIRCCTSGGCQASNSLQVKTRLEMAVTALGLEDTLKCKA
jgi:bidirectional [NiFe] hydrogenase diaphorase subunit